MQVKAWSETRIRTYRQGTFLRLNKSCKTDDLLVLLVYSSRPHFEVLFRGPIATIGRVEKSGAQRIAFKDMKRPDEIQKLLSTPRARRVA